MTRTTFATIRADIGGKYLADPSLFYLTGPAWFVMSVLVVPNISEPSVLMAASLANLISLATYLGLLLLVRDTLFRRRHIAPIPLLAVAIVGATLGAIKGALTVVIIAALIPGEDFAQALPTRIFAAGVIGVVVLAAASLILATRARFQQESDALVALADSSITNPPSLVTSLSDSEDFRRVKQLVKDTRRALAEKPERPLIAAPPHREDPRLAFRSLSHELWEKSLSKPDVFSVSALLGSVFSNHRYPAWWVALFYSLAVSLPFTLPLEGPLQTLGRLVILSTIIGVVLSLTRMLPRVAPGWGLTYFVIAMSLIAVGNEIASTALFGSVGDSSTFAIGLANFLAISMTCLILSVFWVSLSTAHQVRAELKERFGEDYGVRVIEHRRRQLSLRELAQTLHGAIPHTIKSNGPTAASTLDSAAREELLSDLDELENYLDNAELSDGQPLESWRAQVASAIDRWKGLLDVTVELKVQTNPEPSVTKSLVSVITEGLANALRHGLASTASVSASQEGDHIVVDIIDDGVGIRGGAPGLGSALFDEVSGGRWTITPVENGGGTHLRIPVVG